VGIGFTIGASAAVCSLIGAALYFGKSRGGSYGMAIYRQVGTWVVMLFIFGFLVPGINNWGHGGGLVFGALLGYLLGYEESKRERLPHRVLGALCLFVTVAVLLWSVVTSFAYRFLG
jgi:rhomboid protease GluP